jgi:hypothetical protein
MTIVNDDSRVINKLETSLTDDARVVIYDLQMFIVQAASDKPCHVLNSKYGLVSPGDVRLACKSLANDERTSLFGRKHWLRRKKFFRIGRELINSLAT